MNTEADPRFYEFGPFRLDVQERLLLRDGRPVSLTDRVFDLLTLLVRSEGRALSKAVLMDRLWPDTVVEENNLTVNMSLLRKALGEGPSDRRYIETLPRRGYRFIAPVARQNSPAERVPAEPDHARVATEPELARVAETPVLTRPAVSEFGARGMQRTWSPFRVFVGRERELGQLEHRFDAALAGRGRFVFVTGAPGMGKTELCGQLRARRGDGVLVATGHCFEHYSAKEAYSPFLDVVRALLAGSEASAVRDALKRHGPMWYAYFAAAVGEQAPLGADADASRMIRELADVLEALAAVKPLLLVLEDLHWADPSSLDLLRLIAHRIETWRALIVGTLRAEQVELENRDLKNLRRELLARERCDELALPLLEANAIASYLDARFGEHELPRELGELIHRRTEGQPLFATRLVQLLVERGDLVEASGRWALSRPIPELELGVPSTVRGVIERKFESVEEGDRRALQYASVIGMEFSCSVLAGLLRQDEIALDERLNDLARKHRLLDAVGEEQLARGQTTTRYRFAHALYQDVLYESLAAKRRMALHREVAERLLDENSRSQPRTPAQIAAHFERARDFRRAIEFWSEAADQASRFYADVQAAEQYRHALAMLDRLEPKERVPLRIILLYNHAWCRSKIGEHDTGLRDFEEMLRCASAPDFTAPGEEPERARSAVFEFFEAPWRDAFGVYDMPRMPNQNRSFGPPAIQCEAYWGICYTLLEANRLDELGERAMEYLRLAQAAGNETRKAEALAWLAGRELRLANFREAMRLADESTRIALANDHFRTISLSLFYRATAEYRAGEYENAETHLLECLELVYEAQSHLSCVLYLAKSRAHRGDVAGARAALDEAQDIATRKARDAWMASVLSASGDLHRELGELGEALECFADGAEIAARSRSLPLELETLVQLGHVHALRGELDQARSAFTRADRLQEVAISNARRPAPLQQHDFELLDAWARAELGLASADTDAAEHHANRLLHVASAGPAPRHVAIARNLLARVALCRGEPARAHEHIDKALHELGDRSMPFVRARLASTLASLTR